MSFLPTEYFGGLKPARLPVPARMIARPDESVLAGTGRAGERLGRGGRHSGGQVQHWIQGNNCSIQYRKYMDIEKAIKVVKEYGRILREKPIKNVQGRLISLLPYDKETIKEAIKVELIYAGTAEPRDEKMIRTLKLAFLQLASFLPDGEVVPEFDVDVALASDDVCHNYYKYLDGSEKVSNHILEQTSVLVEELDEFCQDNGL